MSVISRLAYSLKAALAIENHHHSVSSLVKKTLSNRKAANPTGTSVHDVKTGCPGQAQFVLKEVGGGRFDPASAHARIDEEVDVFGVDSRCIQGLLAGLEGKVKGPLTNISMVTRVRTGHSGRTS